jgi:hypothetical protein
VLLSEGGVGNCDILEVAVLRRIFGQDRVLRR